MSIPVVSQNSVPPAGPGGGDVGDVALAVAVLQMELLDGEISGRLTALRQLNEIRKACTDRIAQLNDVMKALGDEGGWVSPDEIRRIDYSWDAAANDVSSADGGTLAAAGFSYRVRMPDGREATNADVLDTRPVFPGFEPGGGAGFLDGVAEASGHMPFRAGSVEAAEAAARALGGTVEVRITKEQIAAEVDRLRGNIDNLSSDGEIGMLQLNRLLNRRNQTLQLASNVMASVHQSAMGIINNLRV